MGLVIDTSALIALERSAEVPPSESLGEPVLLPAVVWAEAMVGVHRAATPEIGLRRHRRLERLRELFDFCDFDREIAERYAELVSALARKGRMIPQNDLAVAATALYLNHKVLIGHSDEKHFREVPNLEIVVLNL